MPRLFEQPENTTPNLAQRLGFGRAGSITENMTFTNFIAWIRSNVTSSESVAGVNEIATQTETNTGTDDSRVITPLKLASRTSTTTRAGVIELATQAEVDAGSDTTRAVTPSTLANTSLLPAYNTAIIEIGDWNMDTDSTKSVTHGLTFTTFRRITAFIRNDNNNGVYPLDAYSLTFGLSGGVTVADNTIVQLTRADAGVFDSVNFDSTSYNRGWVIIEYV